MSLGHLAQLQHFINHRLEVAVLKLRDASLCESADKVSFIVIRTIPESGSYDGGTGMDESGKVCFRSYFDPTHGSIHDPPSVHGQAIHVVSKVRSEDWIQDDIGAFALSKFLDEVTIVRGLLVANYMICPISLTCRELFLRRGNCYGLRAVHLA
jgi:hypothetical protein